MAEGRIKDLIDQYEEIRERKERLSKESAEAGKEFKSIQNELAMAISDADMASVQDGDYSYSPKVKRRYNFKSPEVLAELGIDKLELFKGDDRLRDLLQETISASAMNSTLAELANTEDGIPDEVMEALNIYDEITISRTSTDTIGKKRVKEVIKARRNRNV